MVSWIITTLTKNNSIVCPLVDNKEHMNINVDWVSCDDNGLINVDKFMSYINLNTGFVILNYGSNVIQISSTLKRIMS